MLEEISIDEKKCCYCGGCVGVCPEDALVLKETELKIDRDRCTLCGNCLIFCPVRALFEKTEEPPQQMPAAENLTIDVVVVGAGPAGSLCARCLARSGIEVIVVEKKQEIGVPKRCAEAVDIQVFDELGIETNPLWLVNRIQTAALYSPNGKSVKFGAPSMEEGGCIVERKIFEKHLAKEAICAGARYMLKTMAVGVIQDNGRTTGVVAEQMGKKREIRAKVVIAADGVDSKIARSAGLDTVNLLENYMSCFQYEMAGVHNIDEEAIHLYYGNSIAPGGYVWIFPKGNGLSNVGIGIKAEKRGDQVSQEYLDEFIRMNPSIFSGASAVEYNCGGVPVNQTVRSLTADGLMIIGDAAQMVNPITGGGLNLAMIAGKMAAEVAIDCIRRGDVRSESLREYEKKWKIRHGKELNNLLKLQRFTERLTDEDLNSLADILTGRVLEDMARGKYSGFMKLLITRLPSLTNLAVKYLKS